MLEEGKSIRIRLLQNDLSQVWLVGKLREYGENISPPELSGILSGMRLGDKADRVLAEIQEILDKMEAE